MKTAKDKALTLMLLSTLAGAFLITGALAANLHCSNGPFEPAGSVTLDLPPDGVFNFTYIKINEGIVVRFRRNAANTPVFFQATGDVTINGQIIVSASGTIPSKFGGPGSFDGGDAGFGDIGCLDPGCRTATDGGGPGGGSAGPNGNPKPGIAGGGGGNATPGSVATRYTPGAPGGPDLPFPEPLAGGSGGGGGGGWSFFGVQLDGGVGGAGGGAMRISTTGDIIMGPNSIIMADGMHGGYAFTNIGGTGGPGAGGSGGNIDLIADNIIIQRGALLQTRGGLGGGLSTQPYSQDPPAYTNHANGGFGYVRFQANTVSVAFESLDTGVLGIPGAVDLPLLPIDPNLPPWTFTPTVFGTFGMGINLPIYYDPDPAVGYDYEVNGPNFAGFTLPTGVGDDVYDLLLFDDDVNDFVDTNENPVGGVAFDLTTLDPNGFNRFRILGIEAAANIDPNDPLGFPTGLMFANAGTAVVTMTPIEPSQVCFVDFLHFARFARQWRESGTGLPADLDDSKFVDYADLQLFVDEWLRYCSPDWPLK
jgi:hypothetical protein